MKQEIKTKNPYPTRPLEPIKPQEKILEESGKIIITINNYESVKIPSGATEVFIEVDCDEYSGHSIDLSFYNSKLIDDPEYTIKLAKYNSDYKQYTEDLKIYNKAVKNYNKQRKFEIKELRRIQYEKLKKEFES